jgi:alpha-tubulin suppressor-like RCC1 family protein
MGLGPGPVADSGGVYDTAATAWGDGRLFLGEELTCGVRDGAIACAGMNDSGQLGALATHFPADEDTPVPSPAMTSAAIEMAVGNGHACALLADHTIVCRGWSTGAALGRAITTDDCDGRVGAFGACDVDFAPVASTLSFDHVWGSGFTSYVCAREMGTEQVLCWGGTVGDCLTTATSCYRPTHVPALDRATSIAIGTSSVCAVLADGTVKCIGNGDHGQLGRGTIATSSMILRDDVPVCLAPPCS